MEESKAMSNEYKFTVLLIWSSKMLPHGKGDKYWTKLQGTITRLTSDSLKEALGKLHFEYRKKLKVSKDDYFNTEFLISENNDPMGCWFATSFSHKLEDMIRNRDDIVSARDNLLIINGFN